MARNLNPILCFVLGMSIMLTQSCGQVKESRSQSSQDSSAQSEHNLDSEIGEGDLLANGCPANLTSLSSEFIIDSGHAYTNKLEVILKLCRSDTVRQIRFANGTDCSNAAWQDYKSSIPVVHTVLPGDGLKSICLEVKDILGKTAATAFNNIKLDTKTPSGQFSFENFASMGAVAVFGPNADSTVVGTVEDDKDGRVGAVLIAIKDVSKKTYLSFNGADDFVLTQPDWMQANVPPSDTNKVAWKLAIADLPKILTALKDKQKYEIELQVQDQAGNLQSTPVVKQFTWDNLPPPKTTFKVNGNEKYTNQKTVNVKLDSDQEIVQYRIANGSSCEQAAWQPYTNRMTIPLTLNPMMDGPQEVCLQVADHLKNAADPRVVIITYDATPPKSSQIAIPSTLGPKATKDYRIATGLASDATTTIDLVEVSIQRKSDGLYYSAGSFRSISPAWIKATAASKGSEISWNFEVPVLDHHDAELYQILVRATDSAGNVESDYATAEYLWDSKAPNPDFEFSNNPASTLYLNPITKELFTSTADVKIVLTDNRDMAKYRISNTSDCSKATWEVYEDINNPTLNQTLIDSNGQQNVCLQVMDSLNNESNTIYKGITFDNLAPNSRPELPPILGPNSTHGAQTALSGTASDNLSGVASVEVAITDGFLYLNSHKDLFNSSSKIWFAATTTDGWKSWQVEMPDSAFKSGKTYTIESRARDNLRNTQSTLGKANIVWEMYDGFVEVPSSKSGLGYNYFIMRYEASLASGNIGADVISKNESELSQCSYEFHTNLKAFAPSCGTRVSTAKARSTPQALPLTDITWDQAFTICRNMSSSDFIVRLPTSEEWRRAAKWVGGSYSDMWDQYTASCNHSGTVIESGRLEQCKTDLNIFDMAGNVSEWVDDRMLPYNLAQAKEDRFGYGPTIGRSLENGIDQISRRYHLTVPSNQGLALSLGSSFIKSSEPDMEQFGTDVQQWIAPNAGQSQVGFRCVGFPRQTVPSMEALSLPREPQYTNQDIAGKASNWKIPENRFVGDTKPEALNIEISQGNDQEAEGSIQLQWQPWYKKVCNPTCTSSDSGLTYLVYRFDEPNRSSIRTATTWALSDAGDKPLDPLTIDPSQQRLYRPIAEIKTCHSHAMDQCRFTDSLAANTGFSPKKIYNYIIVVKDASGNEIGAMTQRFRSPYFAGQSINQASSPFRMELRLRRAAVFLVHEAYQQSLVSPQTMVHVPMDQSGLDHDFFIHKYEASASPLFELNLDPDPAHATFPMGFNAGSWNASAAKCHDTFLQTLDFDPIACGNGYEINSTTASLQSTAGAMPLVNINQGNFWKACRNTQVEDGDGAIYYLSLPTDSQWLKAADWGDLDLDGYVDQSVETGNIGHNIASKLESGSSPDLVSIRCHTDSTPPQVLLSGSSGAGSTANCRSRYGAADMVGNVMEWTSGQQDSRFTKDNGIDGLWFNQMLPERSSVLASLPAFDLWRGIPIAGAGAKLNNSHNGDMFLTGPGLSASLRGGYLFDGTKAGRWTLNTLNAPSYTSATVGGRCVL